MNIIFISFIIFILCWGLIVYAYLLFPFLIALLATGSRRKPALDETDEDDLPRVAVIVAAHNEQRCIEAKVINTLQLDYPPDRLRLVIGSDGSGDRTPDLLRELAHPRLETHIFQTRRGKVSVLNDLMADIDADIVLLSDADTCLASDAVRKIVRHFRDPQVGCVNGALQIDHGGGVSGEGLYWKYELWIKRQESRLGFVIGCYGGILAIRPELYQPLPATTIVEDFVLTMNVMKHDRAVLFDAEAHATEPASASSHDEWERKVRIGAGDYQSLGMTKAMLHPRYGLRAWAFWSHKVLRWFAPFLILAALLCNIALAVSGGPLAALFRILLAGQTMSIALAALAYRLPRRARLPVFLRPPSYFYLMNSALLVGFLRWVRGTQPVTWRQAARQTAEQVS